MELLEWFAAIGVIPDAQVSANLAEEQIDRQAITLLTDSQLVRLGFSLHDRARIIGIYISFARPPKISFMSAVLSIPLVQQQPNNAHRYILIVSVRDYAKLFY